MFTNNEPWITLIQCHGDVKMGSGGVWETMWMDNGLCRLCLVYTRSKDLIKMNKEDKLHELLIKLAELVKNTNSRSMAFAESFNYVKHLLNSKDPYRHIKYGLNQLGMRLVNEIESYLERVDWDLNEAMRLSAAANIIDTAVLGYEANDLQRAIWDKPLIEEIPELPRNKDIYLVLDNAGEAVIDILLAKTLKRHGYRVVIAVRKESYEIDVLLNDLEHMSELAEDIDIVETPGNISPLFHITGDDVFVIAKGIANLEAYIEMGEVPSLHLFRAKCDVLAKVLSVPKNSPIIVTGYTAKKLILREQLWENSYWGKSSQ
ncbi:MAG: ARMT1-like domain-containing protein [Desulfurococcaceae archaeon]